MIKRVLNLKSKAMMLLVFWLSSVALMAQDRTVTGKVTSASDGVAVPGANVIVKGTTQGVVTDAEGNYTISLGNDATHLIFSFVGLVTQEIEVAGRSVINVSMEEDLVSLSEVVVVGYGVQQKKVVTGSIGQLKAEDFANYSASDINQSLQGRVAGVQLTPSSGAPGSGFNIKIRGTGSNGGTNPLFIVDGMRVENINHLDPNDIERIEVLKDAASASIYGVGGGNGVVLVTTKGGNRNQGTVQYDMQLGVQSVKPNMTMMNLSQYEEYLTEAGLARPAGQQTWETNWADETFQNAPLTRHNLTLSGGNDKTVYSVGAGLFRQDGVVGGDKASFDRTNIRFSVKSDIKDWLEVGSNYTLSTYSRAGIPENTEFGGVLQSVILMDPGTPVTYDGAIPDFITAAYGVGEPYVMDENGRYYGMSTIVNGETTNPLARIAVIRGNGGEDLLSGSSYLTIKPIEGLKITSRFGLYTKMIHSRTWSGDYRMTETEARNKSVSQFMGRVNNYQWENFVNYTKSFGANNIDVMVGNGLFNNSWTWVSGTGQDLVKALDQLAYLGAVPDRLGNTYADGLNQDKRLLSYFGRVSYDFDQKYLFTASFRADGASVFAPGSQWGYFPAFSAGWVISSESFYSLPAVNFLKLRASWGQNGYNGNVNPGASLSLINTGHVYYNADNQPLTGADLNQLPNPSLTWETSEQIDIGIDFGLWDDKLIGAVDYFNKKTKDLLNAGTASAIAGNPAGLVNLGNVSNRGVEIELGYRDKAGDISYSIDLNATFMKNEVTKVNAQKDFEAGANIGTSWQIATAMQEGFPMWFFRGYETDGIFQNQSEIDAYLADVDANSYNPAPGDPVIVDQNADGLINDQDFTMIGSPHPDMLLGATVGVDYKGLDLKIFLQSSFGNEMIMGFNRTDRARGNKPDFFYEDRWTGDGSTNDWFRAGAAGQTFSSDLMVFDASFTKIRQIQVGYTLPSSILSNYNIGKVRAYISLDNFFLFTKYPGFDPEVSGSGDPKSLGIDRGIYPVPRTFVGGISVQF